MYATQTNKVKALTDITVFAELINFQGGWSKFGTIHKKLAGFVSSPQVAKPCVELRKSRTKLTYNRRRLLLMPRGHLKSTVCSVLYVLWRIYRNPNIRILVGCNLKELSESFVRELRQYLEDPEIQERVWNKRPHISGRLIPVMDAAGRKRRGQKSEEEGTETEDKKLKWTTTALQVLRDQKLKEPTVLATSVGTRVTGQHYDLLILDDIVDFDNCSTPQKISKVFEWAQDMESVIDPSREVVYGKVGAVEFKEQIGDEVVVLGTRYENGDYYDYLMENMVDLEYKCFVRNIYRNGQNWVRPTKSEEDYLQVKKNWRVGDVGSGYIWDNKFNEDYVRRLKARTTARRWASQYLNTIISSEEQVLKMDKVKYFRSAQCISKDNGTVEIRMSGETKPHLLKPFMVVDPAASTKDTADNTSICVGGVDEERNVFIIDTKIGKFTPNQTIEHIYALAEKWRMYAVCVETNGVGAGLPYGIKDREKWSRPLIVREQRSTGNKKERIEARLQPLLENGKLYLADWMATNEIINNEFMFFPRETAKDDFLDSVDMLCQVAFPTPRTFKGKGTVTPKLFVNSKYGGCR